MERQIPWHDIYHRLESVRSSLDEIVVSYSRLSKVIAKERQSIMSYDILGVEEGALEKKNIGIFVSERLEKIKDHCKEIFNVYKLHVRDAISFKGFSVSSLEKIIDALKEVDSKTNSTRVLDKVMHSLNVLIKKFIKTVDVLQPKIDANNIALQKLLQSYQASHKFWQDMIHLENSSYDAQGLRGKNNTQLPSSIEIKA